MTNVTLKNGTKPPTDWEPNATYGAEPPAEWHQPTAVAQRMAHGRRFRRTVAFVADHGIGKTAAAKEYALKDVGRYVYWNLATASPEDKIGIFVTRDENGDLELQQQIAECLASEEPFWLILDEMNQAHPKVRNQAMQVTNQWELGERKLNCVGVVMLDNVGKREGIRAVSDPAQADRKTTKPMKANDTGWRYALARKYKDIDLKGAFAVWDSLTPELRHILAPRTLDHMIQIGLLGYPLICALPMPGGKRKRLVHTDTQGRTQDRTRDVLERIAAAIGAPNPEKVPDLVAKIINDTVEHDLNVLIVGPPGCGKTAFTRHLINAKGLQDVYYPMATTDPEQVFAPVPDMVKGHMSTLLVGRLRQKCKYTLVLDEYNRPMSQAAFSKLMEPMQERTIDGIELPGLSGVIALCNPEEWLGRKMSVSKNNIAQADRFHLSVEITPDDIPANEHLLAKWGADAEVVLEWWKEDITDDQRDWVTKRTMERLIENNLSKLPLQEALIYLDDLEEYAPVPLLDLEARFANRPQTGLGEILSDLPKWTKLLLDASAKESAAGNADVETVVLALTKAEVSQLEAAFEDVTTLTGCLEQTMKGVFLDGSGNADRQKFWLRVLVELHKRDVAAKAKVTA